MTIQGISSDEHRHHYFRQSNVTISMIQVRLKEAEWAGCVGDGEEDSPAVDTKSAPPQHTLVKRQGKTMSRKGKHTRKAKAKKSKV